MRSSTPGSRCGGRADGACDELAGMVLERYAEALFSGDIRMNCRNRARTDRDARLVDKLGSRRPRTITQGRLAELDPSAKGHGHQKRGRRTSPTRVGGLPGGTGSSMGPGQPGPRRHAGRRAG